MKTERALPRLLLGLALLLGPAAAFAQVMPALTATPAPNGGTSYSLSVQTLLLLTSLTFIPAVVLMMTSFTRIIIVFSLLRTAMGTQTSPPNQVLLGLALFLTLFIMAPVAERVYTEAYQPMAAGEIGFDVALERASVPMKTFMLAQIREPDLSLFAQLAEVPPVDRAEELPMRVIVPAFVTSELKTAFQIGFIIFIPFIIIDMVVASVLMSMGMMMMSPIIVSLPFKLMLFVLVDGWTLLIGSLVRSFAV
ncbi:flagellar type III secretion system pore protein FliP [Pseudothauera nasutitermitis]|uniref:Flagellar biosynthetic protein FliP n=1 Tax=Pseudothauera nasutitermitis TaxID=2565930 RepID=A0A4S4B054_9RHOO|nr:flagellar type III secretion system pore protein FliP [Pseudothauera nasutitermitis]THF65716.1 flagellar type III secretion system pore protein FliP [Pseudothauera nasutitermitis]